ncbi:hypothetical protein B0H11DRAFT_2214107 [Mycena galericulata]|nr:hypothetical protein B0H11DRAFT_2214107 [Mycena galericulata]
MSTSPGSHVNAPLRVDHTGAVVARLLPTPPRASGNRSNGPLHPLRVDHTGAVVPRLLPTPPRSRTRGIEENRPARPLRINRGPPSTIPLSFGARTAAAGGSRAARASNAASGSGGVGGGAGRSARASNDAPRPPVPPRVRRAPLGTAAARAAAALAGRRTEREEPLTREQLWVNGAGPPDLTTTLDHRECSVCHQVKSHPVSYECGHSHCYVCVRVWLEHQWTCPLCTQVMWAPPFRNYVEEAGLAYDFPDWVDTSIVTYSWDGLTFPCRPIIPDSP